MSQSFPSPDQRPPKRGGGGLIFVIVIGIALFMMFGGGQTIRPGNSDKIPGGSSGPGNDERQVTIDDLLEKNSPGRNTAKKDGWSMEEVDTEKQASSSTNPTRPTKKSTKKDGWTMEEVETDDPKNKGFKFSQQEDEPKQKSSQKGDWSIEEKKGSDK